MAARSIELLRYGIGVWGNNIPVGWALRHHQLRLVDRHRPRRHADLRHPAAVPPGVAHEHQPLRRGDDALRRRVRRHLPAAARRPAVAVLLAAALPEHDGPAGRSSAARWCGTCSPSARTRTVSLLFWYVGLIPDLATLRDRAQQPRRRRSSTASLAMGWRGSALHWHRYEMAYLLLAGLATPLVVSVHTVVSLRLRRRSAARAGTRRSSRPTSSPAPSSAASRWC